MFYPTLSEAKAYQEDCSFHSIPITMELFSDIRTPMEVLRILKNASSHCYMLESIEDNEKWGRYTFLGYEPTMELTCTDGLLTITTNTVTKIKTQNPGSYIRQIIENHRSPKIPSLPPFTGGLVGYFSYDYIKYAEPGLRLDAEDREHFKDVDLMLFDKVIAFDNFRQKII